MRARRGLAGRIVGVIAIAVMASGLWGPECARAQGSGLSLVLSVNQSVFGAGTTLAVTLGVDNTGPAVQVDLLFGAILPDGDTVVFFESPALVPGTGRLSQLASLRPMFPGLGLGAGTTTVIPNFFRYAWQGSEPLGTYRVFFAATRPGALSDGRLDGGDLVALETLTVSMQPAASVTPDPARSASAQLSTQGGTLAATAADGTTYTLTVPAGALTAPATITLTPVSALTGLPAGLTLIAAVQAEPSGLTLGVPATVTIVPPGGSAPASVVGFVTSSTGAGLELLPAGSAAGGVMVLGVTHFSVVAAAVPTSPAELQAVFGDAGIYAISQAFPDDASASDLGTAFAAYFASIVRPLLVSGQTDTDALLRGINEFVAWDLTRVIAQGVRLGGTTVLQGSDALLGRQLIASGLRAALARANAECAATRSLARAEEVLRLQALASASFEFLTYAVLAGFSSVQEEPLFGDLTGLDLASVVAGLCVRVEILGVEFPDVVEPGVVAPLTVQAGLVLTSGGAPLFAPPLQVRVDAVGASPGQRVGLTGADGRFATAFTPSTAGVALDILATFVDGAFPYVSLATLTDTASIGRGGGVVVSPPQTTIAAGESRQFTATVEGTTNQAVTWDVSGGGSITQAGLFTSDGTPGTFFVTATSVADPSAVGIAQVTVAPPPEVTATLLDVTSPFGSDHYEDAGSAVVDMQVGVAVDSQGQGGSASRLVNVGANANLDVEAGADCCRDTSGSAQAVARIEFTIQLARAFRLQGNRLCVRSPDGGSGGASTMLTGVVSASCSGFDGFQSFEMEGTLPPGTYTLEVQASQSNAVVEQTAGSSSARLVIFFLAP
jgi:hypothetical protein